MKELGGWRASWQALRQELAALTLKQSSSGGDQVGLPQQLQAVRDGVSWDPLEFPGNTPPLRRSWESAGRVPPALLWAQTLAFSDGSSSRFSLIIWRVVLFPSMA